MTSPAGPEFCGQSVFFLPTNLLYVRLQLIIRTSIINIIRLQLRFRIRSDKMRFISSVFIFYSIIPYARTIEVVTYFCYFLFIFIFLSDDEMKFTTIVICYGVYNLCYVKQQCFSINS